MLTKEIPPFFFIVLCSAQSLHNFFLAQEEKNNSEHVQATGEIQPKERRNKTCNHGNGSSIESCVRASEGQHHVYPLGGGGGGGGGGKLGLSKKHRKIRV